MYGSIEAARDAGAAMGIDACCYVYLQRSRGVYRLLFDCDASATERFCPYCQEWEEWSELEGDWITISPIAPMAIPAGS